jgi:tetratricopeptide (TPR) repeat protein
MSLLQQVLSVGFFQHSSIEYFQIWRKLCIQMKMESEIQMFFKKCFFSTLMLFLFISTVNANAEEADRVSIGMLVTPDIAIPLGDKAQYYNIGGGGRLSSLFGFSKVSWISPRLDVSYTFVPVKAESTASVSLIRASAGAQSTFHFGEHVSIFGYGTFGGYYALLSGPITANDLSLSYHCGLGAGLQLFNSLSLLIGADYNSFLGTYDAFSVFLGIATRVAGNGGGPVPFKQVTPLRPDRLPSGGLIEISDVQLETVFPVLRKYYDVTPIGTAVIRNTSDMDLADVEVRVKPAKYIDSTKLSARIPMLVQGSEKKVDLYVLFNDEILSITEGAKVVTDIEVTYRVGNREGSDKETVTLETYDRNALQWDDDRKIAAFVTAKDDEIQRFAKNMASLAQDVRIDAVNPQLQLAMVEYAAMIEQGLTYVVDPSSAYEDMSENPKAVDFVQFPRQTLYVKAGDCDDLSATFCTLLESLGIDTAFITVPGHIYTAFRMEMTETEAERIFSKPEDLIYRDDGTVWVPIETTVLEGGFLKAWAIGAKQWRTYNPEGQAGFIEIKDAWRTYQPVAFSVSQIELSMPGREAVISRVKKELDAFVSQEIHLQEQKLLSRLQSRQNDPPILNRLGIIYARYGKYEEAKARFEQALSEGEYVPAMVNLANLDFIEGDFGHARNRYEQVLRSDKENVSALVGLAKVEHELENFGSARAAYNKLASVSSELAEKYAYLSSASVTSDEQRASDAARLRTSVVWQEGEL